MKIKILITLGLFALTSTLPAQTNFKNGYVINNEGDTLYGKIDFRGDLLMSRVCKFKGSDDSVNEYAPQDIYGYRFIDSKYYVTKEINNEKVFLEYLIKGKVNIYYLRDEKGDHYFLEKEGVPLTIIPYEEGIKYVDNKPVYFQSTKHIGILNYYMQDASGIIKNIKNVEKPEHQNLIELAKKYHNSVCEDEECIVFEKKQSLFKVNFEVLAGTVYLNNINNLRHRFNLQTGAIINIWMPRTNEKIYIKTGLLYSRVVQDDETRKIIKVPIHLGYIAPNTFKIRPTFSIGLLSPSYTGGFAVKLNKYLNVGVQSWVNFHSNEKMFLFPDELYNYSILASFLIEL